jgi:inosine/xanthosine triphosphatase
MRTKEIRLVIASRNPVKVDAALGGIKQMFPEIIPKHLSISVPSDIRDQPMSDEETLQGAHNRAYNAMQAYPESDLWIGIEGGVQVIQQELTAFAWVVIRSRDVVGKARSGAFFLPKAVAELVEQGIELGLADDMVFGSKNSKQAGGAVGLLTQNQLNRKQLYEQAVVLALIPFKNEQLYQESSSRSASGE